MRTNELPALGREHVSIRRGLERVLRQRQDPHAVITSVLAGRPNHVDHVEHLSFTIISS
jgi:hypothetical protein